MDLTVILKEIVHKVHMTQNKFFWRWLVNMLTKVLILRNKASN